MTLDEFHQLADSIAEELPTELFHRLTGGISISPSTKYHANSNPVMPLNILGEYHCGSTGRYIMLYYGSFMRVYGHIDMEAARGYLRDVILHEFRHHLESLAGERGLEVEDAIRHEQYKQSLKAIAQAEDYPQTVHYTGGTELK